MWVAIVSLESNHEPKFLADDTGVIVAVPTRRLLIDTLAGYFKVPMIMNSGLSSFSFNLSFNIHLRMSSIHLSTLAKAAIKFTILGIPWVNVPILITILGIIWVKVSIAFTILGITWGNVSILFTTLGITWGNVPP